MFETLCKANIRIPISLQSAGTIALKNDLTEPTLLEKVVFLVRQWLLHRRPRLNCERIPVIPASIVRANFDDPRKIPYLLAGRMSYSTA